MVQPLIFIQSCILAMYEQHAFKHTKLKGSGGMLPQKNATSEAVSQALVP